MFKDKFEQRSRLKQAMVSSEQTRERRLRLRSDLISTAERIIAKEGLGSLTARGVAGDVGCSVGAIYNVFEDLDGLIVAVNSRTLAKLDRQIARASPDDLIEHEPENCLVEIGLAYCRFAIEETRLWSALFEQAQKPNRAAPDWHLDEHVRLVRHIERILKHLMPERGDDQLSAIAASLISAVHGIVFVGLQELFFAVPTADIEEQIAFLLRSALRGMRAG